MNNEMNNARKSQGSGSQIIQMQQSTEIAKWWRLGSMTITGAGSSYS